MQDGNGYAICISAVKSSPKNFWNGQWTSEWILRLIDNGIETAVLDEETPEQPPLSATLQGTQQIKVHYYEEGNVQLFTNSTILRPLEGGADYQAIFNTIIEEEDRFQGNLNSSYDSLSENTFKILRRALPITKSKLDWDKIFAYKLGASIGNRPSIQLPAFPFKKS
jgi:capping protein alpha